MKVNKKKRKKERNKERKMGSKKDNMQVLFDSIVVLCEKVK